MLGLNTLDLLIILLALLAISRGIQIGFFRQVLSLIGFFSGLFLGSLLAPYLVRLVGDDQLSRLLVTLGLTLGLAMLLSGVGEYYGRRLRFKLAKPLIVKVETGLGIALSVASTVIVAWLAASILLRLPTANIAAHISESKIMQLLDRRLPPAPAVMARLGQLISPEGFPRVFTGIEPFSPDAGRPNQPAVAAAAAAAAASTVRIEGLGCGGAVFGSGFIIAANIVATNAHVVAGIRQPVVADQSGRHRATPVWFDPDLDLALLEINEHAGPPLDLATEVQPRGTTAAALGFPGGQQFTASPAVVLNRHTAIGRNIYDTSLSQRDVYELQTDIHQGNSGGPLVLPDGRVIGMVFGKSAARSNRGFGLTSLQIEQALAAWQGSRQATVTGSCVRT